MDFRILGPIELWAQERRHNIGWAKERHILASLLLTPGKPVSAESLVNRLWDDNPPTNARDLLNSQVSRLRARLHAIGEAAHLRNRSGAYVLETDQENVDYHRFRRLRAQARAIGESGDDYQAVQLLRDAATLWRGEPLAGLSGSWATRIRKNLENELLTSTVDRAGLELRLGHHADLVAELSELVDRFPFDEKLVELLMMALYRAGRQADALEAYRRTWRRLDEELATEASRSLQELHQSMLRGDASLQPPFRTGTTRNDIPKSLPRDKFTFAGRAREIDRLISATDARQSSVAVIAIDGMAGVGKTTLAVHLAHQLIDRYPDGQLYLKLHGYDVEQPSVDPATALDRLLRSIGVPGSHIPKGLEDRATLWRTELSRRRMLLVLDDATGHEQISHLLPGAPGCLVVITSRRRLVGLDDVETLTLDVLPPDDAAALFTRIISPRGQAPPDDVDSVVRLCGYLPLAIQLVGSRALHRPAWEVADIAAVLREDNRRLAEIRAGDREITTAFGLSFHGLGERQQRAFRALGLHPGRDFALECVAALLMESPAAAEGILDDLLNHHLITELRHDRYRFHDLIGSYARQLSADEPTAERQEILRRIFDYYLFTADRADRLLYPERRRITVVVTPAPQVHPVLNTADEAKDWVSVEIDTLVRVTHHAANQNWLRHAALFAHVLGHHLEKCGRWEEAADLHERAVTAWRELADQAGIARALSDLAEVRWRAGKFGEALQRAAEALAIQRAVGNQHGIAGLLDQIGLIHWHRSEFDLALSHFDRALQIRRSMGDRRGETVILNHIAIIHWHTGDYVEAADRLREALGISQEIGDRGGQQIALNNIGDVELRFGHHMTALNYYEEAAVTGPEMGRQHRAIWLNNVANVYRATGRYTEALEHYRTALNTYREIGDRRCEADVLNNIGCCYAQMGDGDAALIHHQRALHIARDLSERYEECRALRHIGDAHQRAGRHDKALDRYRQALDLARDIGDIDQQALTLDQMGTSTLHARGRPQAEECWRAALTLYERLGVPEADTVRSRLAR
ncbi:tetratricopeptide repeat protein [Streptosporangium sp. KLBMP 9127]|nr:tetratricopeptide repeat protein [Streptosporangium sp. KLBMP 9127]